MKKLFVFLLASLLLFTMVGCSGDSHTDMPDVSDKSKIDTIPFADGQLYGVAYLGYEEMSDLTFYLESNLDDENLPIHYISNGEFYLVIPRYDDMTMRLYRNDHETAEKILVYEEAASRPFIVQCNVSDIFADTTICFTYQAKTVEFSPHISLVDGSVEVGENGLDITHK